MGFPFWLKSYSNYLGSLLQWNNNGIIIKIRTISGDTKIKQMTSMKINYYPVLLLCLFMAVLTACKDKEDYKKEIETKEVIYSAGSFLNEAGAGNIQRVRLFFKAGMDVNARGTNNETALMLALANNNHEMAKLLIANKADINAKTSGGYTALMIVSTLGDLQAINILMEAGADINAMNNDGETPLMLAALNDRTETVELLLKKGADINVRNNKGETALDHAFLNTRVSEILRKAAKKE